MLPLSRIASKTYERSLEVRLLHYKTHILRAKHSRRKNAPVRKTCAFYVVQYHQAMLMNIIAWGSQVTESLFWLSDLRPPSPQKKWQYAHWMLMCAWPTFTWSFRTNYSLGKITCTLTANWRKVTYKLLEPRAELDCNIWIFGDKIERCDCHDYLSTSRSSSHSTLISCCTWCRLLFSVSLIHFCNFIYFVLV